jgi:nucleoside-diphosphate-sugar epimerase
LAVVVGTEALKHNTKKFIEVSNGEVYKPTPHLVNETSEIQPWTAIAKAKWEAEKSLRNLKGLPLIVVRVPMVYGLGDTQGAISLSTCIFVIHEKLKQKVEFPAVSKMMAFLN